MHKLCDIALVLTVINLSIVIAQYSPGEVCTGTFDGAAAGSDLARLVALRSRYSKCRKVEGNLEVTFQPSNSDAQKLKSNASLVDFLNNIVEVTGYVLVSGTFYDKLPLRSLRLIRGERLYRPFHPDAPNSRNSTCALCLIMNPALTSLGFENLEEIRRGDVVILNGRQSQLAYVNSVNWEDLFSGAESEEESITQQLIATDISPIKGACHPSCTSNWCFGPSLQECHYPTRLVCSSCANRCVRATLPQAGTCCWSTCVGGCVNASENGCVSCLKYRDNGRCVSECPPRVVRNPLTNLPTLNTNYKVSFAGECLKTCPAHVVDEQGVCLAACLPGNRELNNGTCVKCLDGEPCPVYCDGNDVPPLVVTVGTRDYMDGDEIKRFANCTHVSGNIAINYNSFTAVGTRKPIDPADLGLLRSVQVVTGFVYIQMERPHNFFRDYSFLENLRIIHGRYLFNDYSLLLTDFSNLEQMGMKNLRRIAIGNVHVAASPCNARTVFWPALLATKTSMATVQSLPPSNPCVPAYRCAQQCALGCWGPADSMCQACQNFKLGDRCVAQCSTNASSLIFYVNRFTNSCVPCNPQCAEACSGPSDLECLGGCKNYRENGRCVQQCSVGYWSDSNRICLPCSSLCERGCTGPESFVGNGGCNDCFRTIIHSNQSVGMGLIGKRCGSRITSCEPGYATQPKGADPIVSGVLCIECPVGCITCDSATSCLVCRTSRLIHRPIDPELLPMLVTAGYTTSSDLDVDQVPVDGTDGDYQYQYEDQNQDTTSHRLAYQSALELMKKSPCFDDGSSRNLSITSQSSFCPTVPLYHAYYPMVNRSCVTDLRLRSNASGINRRRPTGYHGNREASPTKTDWDPMSQPDSDDQRDTAERCRFGDNLCVQCDPFCAIGCDGPAASDCFDCLFARVYVDETDFSRGFNCVDKCPPEKRWRVNETVCTATMPSDEKRKIVVIVVSVSVTLLATAVAIVFTISMLRKRARDKLTTRKYEAEMAGIELQEPLMETGAKPDMSKLTLIKENEVRLGGIIGSGAFGTVYQGFWIPEGERVKIPVAIKVLTEKSTKANTEFMEEVRVMAAVHHPFCIRIAGICMGEQLQLVTPLMPHGSLLDYLRKNPHTITSRQLLTWATQVSVGMNYLEQRAIVHRDLAARNILVAGPDQVRITDFGLAKLLESDEDEYRAEGGKLPIKWLAIESIRLRTFTHKSDVWAFGVTLWEMFTFGGRPYEETPARLLLDKLEKGDRLQQPESCTIDLYMWMIKCWYPDPASRPSFLQLSQEFAKMSRDPHRYLAVRGDGGNGCESKAQDSDLQELLEGGEDDAETDAETSDGLRIVEVDDYLSPVSSSSRPESSTPMYLANFSLPPPPREKPPGVHGYVDSDGYDYGYGGYSLGRQVGALAAARARKLRNCDMDESPNESSDYRYATEPFREAPDVLAPVVQNTTSNALQAQSSVETYEGDTYVGARAPASASLSTKPPVVAGNTENYYSLAGGKEDAEKTASSGYLNMNLDDSAYEFVNDSR